MALSPHAMHRRLQPFRFARRRISQDRSSVERFGSAPFSNLSLSFSPSPLEILLSPLKKSLQTPQAKSPGRTLTSEPTEENIRKMMKQNIVGSLEKPLFQLLFLKNDNKQSVEAFEVEQIDFPQIITHLKRGESVFMSWKGRSSDDVKRVKGRVVRKDVDELWPA